VQEALAAAKKLWRGVRKATAHDEPPQSNITRGTGGLGKGTGSYVRRCVFGGRLQIGAPEREPPTVRAPEYFLGTGLDCHVAKKEERKARRQAVSRCRLCNAVGAGSGGVRLKGRDCQMTAGRDLCWKV
jgi:hypothetical protein